MPRESVKAKRARYEAEIKAAGAKEIRPWVWTVRGCHSDEALSMLYEFHGESGVRLLRKILNCDCVALTIGHARHTGKPYSKLVDCYIAINKKRRSS